MSDTPRCDSTAIGFDDDTRFHLGSTVWFVPADFARQLERELNAAKAEIEALRQEIAGRNIEDGAS